VWKQEGVRISVLPCLAQMATLTSTSLRRTTTMARCSTPQSSARRRLPRGIAGRGRALELGIGTGRIALPRAERGVPVDGIELSWPEPVVSCG
jgi:hypothetical protein